MNLKEAIQKLKDNVKNHVAQEQLKEIPKAIDTYGSEGLKAQLIYILDNCKTWRGDEARETKAFIKEWIRNKNNS